MAPPGVSVPLRFLREAIQKGVSQIRLRLESALPKPHPSAAKLQPAYAHAQHTGTHPLHQRIKVARRWYTTAYRTILQNAAINPHPSLSQNSGQVGRAISHLTKTTPFASTLRPRLTGGAFPRTASGYSLGNGGAAGARFFSHGPASPAEVITQVALSLRAMALSGKNAADEYRSHKSYRKAGVRAHLASLLSQQGTAPGAYVDFHMAPTFTSLSSLSRGKSIANEHFMAQLDEDFTEIVNDVSAVWGELQRLRGLGDLPVGLAGDREDTIRVWFGGCRKGDVERLCDEVGVTRGVVGEERRFGEDLLLPQTEMKPYLESPGGSMYAVNPVHMPQPGVQATGLFWQDMLTESEGESEGELTASQDEGIWTEDGTEYTPPVSVNGYLFGGSSVSALHSPGMWTSSSSEEEEPMAGTLIPQIQNQVLQQGSAPGPVMDLGVEGLQRFLDQCEEYESGGGRGVWE